ncbi:glycosyltransferase involved in cell wall biosynthesis [Ruminococcaceae bacterium R-25]|nr:glycosyltransferase involved in cell wall biosynthesis [Ruminococcaceae bacterium R-25]SUQ11265.1 Glycosyltransferase involved in cell wall bisynthesis [Oscillospiraceae bacterium]
MDKAKKILFVTGSLNRGGAQRVITLLANKYADMGWEVHVALMLFNNVGYQISDKIVIHDLAHGKSAKNALKWVKELRDTIKNVSPSVIVSFVGRINLITMRASKGLGIPVVLSERNDPQHDRRSSFERSMCKSLYKKADKVVFQTRYQADCYKDTVDNGVIIPNPISAPVYEGDHPVKDIICVGKLMDQKNHPMMINAFAKIASEFPDTKVWIYGDGEKRADLTALIRSLGLESRIIMPGNSNNVFEVMRENEYFVMCSDYEGLSNALLEAMRSGMICVSTEWNGITDVISDGENGFLVPVGDVDALADKLRLVLTSDNSEIRRNSIEAGKKYDSDTVMERWVDEINRLAL